MKSSGHSIYQSVKSTLSSTFYCTLALLLVASVVLMVISHKHSYVWFWASAGLTLLLLLLQEARRQYGYLKDFSKLNGKYSCWSYKFDQLVAGDKEFEAKRLTDIDEIEENGSYAEISHQKRNILKIVITDKNDNVWGGYGVMEFKGVGVLTFYYTKLKNDLEPWRRNGIRRIGILPDSNGGSSRICLFSETSPPHGIQRFGRELCIKI